MSKLYSCSAVADLIEKYNAVGGVVYEVEQGVLGYGLTICCADGYKSAVITEVALNCWSSGHKIRMYNTLPKKYADMIENTDFAETRFVWDW